MDVKISKRGHEFIKMLRDKHPKLKIKDIMPENNQSKPLTAEDVTAKSILKIIQKSSTRHDTFDAIYNPFNKLAEEIYLTVHKQTAALKREVEELKKLLELSVKSDCDEYGLTPEETDRIWDDYKTENGLKD